MNSDLEKSTFGVVIADDDPNVCQALGDLIDDHPQLRLIGIARSGTDAATLVATIGADLAVVDVRMPTGGVAAIAAIHEVAPELPVAVYTADRGRRTRSELLDAGAAAVFAKGDSIDLAAALVAMAQSGAVCAN